MGSSTSRSAAETPEPGAPPAAGHDPTPLRILFFGTASTEPGYPRPRVLLRGLRENGATVTECRAPLWAASGDRVHAARALFSLRNAWAVLRAELQLARRFFAAGDHDAVLVGPEGHLDIIVLRLVGLTRRRPIVFDPFISLYDTVVEDRRLVPPGSFKARLLRGLDRRACALADAVVLDTDAMVQHYADDFGQPRSKLVRVFVGEETELFAPAGDAPPPEPPPSPLRVLWFGTHIALHGVPVIVAAAAALRNQNVHFTLIGRGQELAAATRQAAGLDNITFIPDFVPPEQLRTHLELSHVALGIFGTTKKAARVIPCKVFDILSAGRPLVTADTPAMRELVVPERQAILVPPGDADALARALRALRDDPARRAELAGEGLRLFRARATPAILGAELLAVFRRLARPTTT